MGKEGIIFGLWGENDRLKAEIEQLRKGTQLWREAAAELQRKLDETHVQAATEDAARSAGKRIKKTEETVRKLKGLPAR